MQKNRSIFVFALLFLSAVHVSAQVTVILDHDGDGDGNLLLGPRDVTLDRVGNLYVVGTESDNAFKISSTGVTTEIIDGSGDGFWNHLDQPRGVAVDREGNVYVSGAESDNVFQITPDGVKTAIIGAPGDGRGNPLDDPIGLACDDAGNVYVAGAASDNVFKITPAGVKTVILDAAGDGRGNRLDEPRGVTVDGVGNVYVSGGASDNVFKVTRTGAKVVVLDAAGDGRGNRLVGPVDVAVDSAGDVYVAAEASDNVFKVTAAGIKTEIIDALGVGGGQPLDGPWNLAIDSAGNVYVAGRHSDNVFQIAPSGDRSAIVDALGAGRDYPLDQPRGVAVDSVGNVYVSGSGSDRVFLVHPRRTGIIDGGFERSQPGDVPTTFGSWGQDDATLVTTENGVRPASGDSMLKFLSSAPRGQDPSGTACDILQLVALRSDFIEGGGAVVATAMFNRMAGDRETDGMFGIRLRAYDGSPSEFPARANEALAGATTTILTDTDPSTWEAATVELEVPVGASYLCVWIFAREDVVDDSDFPEFDGHYADGVTLRDSALGSVNGSGGEPTFRRGDCNDDGSVDISDALFTLGSLFLGVGDPVCEDACDANDDGSVDISDASATLGVLFLGSGSISLPGMESCGVDPTQDELACAVSSTCESFCDPGPSEGGRSEDEGSFDENVDELLERTKIPSAFAGAFFRLARAYESGRAPASDLEAFAFGVFSDLSEPARTAMACAANRVNGLTSEEQVRLFGDVVGFSDSAPLTASDLADFVAEEFDRRLSLSVYGESDLGACLDMERPGLPRPSRCYDIDGNFEGFCPQICRIDTPALSREIRTVGHVPALTAGEIFLDEVEQSCRFDAEHESICDTVEAPDCTGTWTDGVCLRVPVVAHGELVKLKGYNFFDVDARVTLRSKLPLSIHREIDARVCGDIDTPLGAPVDCSIEDIITFTIPNDLPEGLYYVGVSVPNNTGDPVYNRPWYSSDGPMIRVVPSETGEFRVTVEELQVRRTTADWGSDELGLVLLTVPVSKDGSVGELRTVKWDKIGSLDDGDTRQLDRVLYSGRVDAGLSMSIVGFEIDDQEAYRKGVSSFIDAYEVILESNWSKVADALGEALGAGVAAAGAGEFSKVASVAGAEGIKALLAFWAPAELIIEDAEGLPFVRLAELTSLNFPNPPVRLRTSEGGIDVFVGPCQDTPDVDIAGCSDSAKAPFQYRERRAYRSDEHGSNYSLTLQYSRVQ